MVRIRRLSNAPGDCHLALDQTGELRGLRAWRLATFRRKNEDREKRGPPTQPVDSVRNDIFLHLFSWPFLVIAAGRSMPIPCSLLPPGTDRY